MNGGFLKDGRLWIERAGLPKTADCRFCAAITHVKVEDASGAISKNEAADSYRQGFSCSDHCAHVGEPVKTGSGQIQLALCNGTSLTFDTFKDERKRPLSAGQGV